MLDLSAETEGAEQEECVAAAMKRLSYLQRTLALRLIRLIDQRHLHEAAMSDWAIRMVELCIDAAYRDCIHAGCSDHVMPFMAAYRKRQQAKR